MYRSTMPLVWGLKHISGNRDAPVCGFLAAIPAYHCMFFLIFPYFLFLFLYLLLYLYHHPCIIPSLYHCVFFLPPPLFCGFTPACTASTIEEEIMAVQTILHDRRQSANL
jgi:hypothetical protein